MWGELQVILDQFGAGGGFDPGNNAVRFLLAAYFWAGLGVVALQQYRRLREQRDLYVAVAALVGGSREAVMFLLEYGAWRGWFPAPVSYRVFPPLEHALTDASRVLLGFAYLRYFLPGGQAGRTYLRAGLAVFAGLYLVTAPLWVRFIDANQELIARVGPRFGLFWGDLAFRVAASLFVGVVVARLAAARRAGRPVPGQVLAGMGFLFLDEFLMIFNLLTGDEPLRRVIGPIRHNLGIWAIPLFIWAYWGELLRRVRDEKARSEGILEAIGDGIGIEGPDHRVLYQNPAHRALLGDHAGESCSRMRGGAAGCALEGALAGGGSLAEARTLRTATGPVAVEVTTSRLLDADGHVAGGVEVVRDVTARRQAEDAVRESELRYRTLVENIEHGITLIDRDFRVLMANPAHGRLLGKPQDSVVGRLCYAAIHGRDAVCPDCPGAIALETGRKASVEKSAARADGARFSVRIQAFPVLGPDGAARGFIELVEDTTEAKRSEDERRLLEQRVLQAQKMESLGILAGGIAHDFNNLLMGVLGNTDLALSRTAPESPVRPFLKAVDQAAQRAADLTNQMLAYSGKGRFVVEPLNLSRVVEEIGSLLATVVSKQATVRYRLAPALPPVEADATQVRQVVMNLITNASDALAGREGVISVTTGVMDVDEDYLRSLALVDPLPSGRYVFVEVSDNGAGMDAETRSRIFDPFFTTKHTGRGLGLAAVLGIVRGHRGAIKVYSEPGQGSTFKVLLPALSGYVAAPPEAAAPGPGPARSALPAGSCGTVLVVDDEETVRDTARAMLEACGYAVLTANDGLEGVELFRARSGEVSAVILDMTMPRMGGEEAFREMRRIDERVPVILSSGFNEQDAVNRFTGKGLAGFIQKPYRVQAMREKLAAALAGRAPRD